MRWIDMLDQVAIFIEEVGEDGSPVIRKVTVADLPACSRQAIENTPHDPGRFKLDYPGSITVLCERCYEIAAEPD